jgi:iron(III) transport system substrate-binding protein
MRRTVAIITLTVAAVLTSCSSDAAHPASTGGSSGTAASSTGTGGSTTAVVAPAGTGTPAALDGDIVLYSGQHEQTVTALVQAFEAAEHIKVDVRSDDEATLAEQIIQEGASSPADVFFGENPASLNTLDEKHFLAPTAAATLSAVPAADSPTDGDWVGVSARSVALAYNTKMITEAALPTSVLDFAKPAWKGKVGFAPGETDFQPIITAIIKLDGVDAATTWLKGLKANAKTYDDNEGLVAAVDRGEVATGILDHYYWYRLRDEVGAGKVSSALHFFAAGDPGSLVDVSGAGQLASSKHPRSAQAFLAFLVSQQAQTIIATSESYEYPLLAGVAAPKLVRPMSDFGPPVMSISDLGDGQQALQLLQQVGLL